MKILDIQKLEDVEPFRMKCNAYIGDPCYVIKDRATWADLCDKMWDGKIDRTRDGAVVTTDKGKFFICSTAYGDGCYPVNEGDSMVSEVGVDAGLLSIIPLELLDEVEAGDNLYSLGYKTEVNGVVTAEGGNFDIGNLSVITDGTSDDDDDDEEYLDDDDYDDDDDDDDDEEDEDDDA
jgi:hypothetical protein